MSVNVFSQAALDHILQTERDRIAELITTHLNPVQASNIRIWLKTGAK